MSLIVGYASAEIGFLVADTLVSYPFDQSCNPREQDLERHHCLKIQIINPDVAVAFAGDIDIAMMSIRMLRRELGSSCPSSVAARLEELSQDNAVSGRPSPEFLVMWITRDGAKQLAHISDSGILHCTRAYIGDPNEYQKFRQLCADYHGPQSRLVQQTNGDLQEIDVTEGEREFEQISEAMERLTHQRRSVTVGAICGCVVRVVDARISGKLEYLQSVEASVSPEEEEAGFSLLAANDGDCRGIGIYFRRWHAGLIFIVCDLTLCRKEEALTIHDFVELARQKYGMTLKGGLW